MSTLDAITKEKQRLGEALARVDAQREKLTGQLGELEATERVLARYIKGSRKRWPRLGARVFSSQTTPASEITFISKQVSHWGWGLRSFKPAGPMKPPTYTSTLST